MVYFNECEIFSFVVKQCYKVLTLCGHEVKCNTILCLNKEAYFNFMGESNF